MDHDAIFFTGSGHSLLVSSLSSTGSDFFCTESHPIFMEWNPQQTIKLQLDTNIIFYKPFDNGECKLYEQYSIMGGPSITNEIGTWNKSGGLHHPKINMWERRSDLQGIRLQNAVAAWPHLTDLIYNNQKELVGSKGLFQETLFHLRDALNFTIETVTPDDGQWGFLNKENQTWNGMVGMLVNDGADLATAGKNEASTFLWLCQKSFGSTCKGFNHVCKPFVQGYENGCSIRPLLQQNYRMFYLSAGLTTYTVFFVIFYSMIFFF
jgi:hypothetical protein